MSLRECDEYCSSWIGSVYIRRSGPGIVNDSVADATPRSSSSQSREKRLKGSDPLKTPAMQRGRWPANNAEIISLLLRERLAFIPKIEIDG